jgi:predicted permease
MRKLLYNAIYVLIVAVPLVLLELLAAKSKWVDDRKGPISFAVWILALGAAFWFIEVHGFKLNERFFEP